MTIAVSIQGLRKRYGDFEAVKDVSLQVESGQILGLLGPNGAGKTTTLRCLCTLLRPNAGDLRVCGISAIDNPRAVRKLLGYVAQEVALDKVLTGRELLQLQADLYHMKRAQATERIDTVLKLLDLEARADDQSGTYSGGLKKRLDLAAGLLHEPKVLVLDEPTVGLEIESRVAIWEFLREIRERGITVLITSHYLEEIDALADSVAIIDAGRVIATGTPSELKDQVGGDRLTLRLKEFTPRSEAEQALDVLTGLAFVQNIVINAAQGNALNLVVNIDEADASSEVRQQLDRAGLPVFGLAYSRPSLDDVYLAATGKTLRDAELAAAEADTGGKTKKK
ncbi:MAG: ABC transporter ATP-binding protein [Cyanobacteria bacterium P01_G01_bin.4]